MIRKFLTYSGIAIGLMTILGVLVLMYAYFVEPAILVVNKQTIKVPHWNKDLNGFKVVAISDLHGGSNTMTEEKLRYVVELANAQQPEVIVLLGDYVSQVKHHGKELKMDAHVIAENLKGLKAKYGVFAVIGNHDWWYDEAVVRDEFGRAGFVMLENATHPIDVNGKRVWILGIEDFWKRGRAEIGDALSRIEPKENIVGITHNPDTFDKTPADLSILFAGHTHGGQVWLPFIGAPVPVAKREYTAGHVVRDTRHLFVTKGVGTSGPAIRFCAVPEIAVITLEAE